MVLARPGRGLAGIAAGLILFAALSARGDDPAETPDTNPPAADALANEDEVFAGPGEAAPADGVEDAEAIQAPVPQKAAKPKRRGAQVNPLRAILQNLFPGQRRPAPQQQQEPQAEPEEPKPAPPDARAASNAKHVRWLERATKFLESGEWAQATPLFQAILDDPEDSLVRDAKGRYSSARGSALDAMSKMPAAERDQYELQFGAAASQMLAQAQSTGDVEGIATVAWRFFPTKAGRRAADELASRAIDRGQYGIAAQWFSRLLDVNDPLTSNAQWQMKAAATLHRAGLSETASKLLQALTAAAGEDPRVAAVQTVIDEDASIAPRPHIAKEWPIVGGTSDRAATSTAGEPLLLSRWSQPLTYKRPIDRQIQEITEDLTTARTAPIPAMFPLAVGGKIVYRTLRGVQVVDAQSGKLLWEVQDSVAIEDVILGMPDDHEDWQPQNVVTPYSGQPDQHPLTNLLYRDGAHGIISSDGEQLFVIEDKAILPGEIEGFRAWENAGEFDSFGRDWATNSLTSYDLETGRPLWRAGGRLMNEPFDSPLAGFYFLGAPVADGDELFVVAESAGEVRLLCLERKTGARKWSQLLGVAEAKIEQDFVRRFWSAQVAIGNGVIVCPTTVGWIVGIDRATHSILWARALSTRTEEDRQNGGGVSQPGELNARWPASAPIIVGDRVICTPQEEPQLLCLDLHTGATKWNNDKGNRYHYVAGVADGRLIVVGSEDVRALSLSSGSSSWMVPLDDNAGPAAGFGAIAGNRLHLPLTSGQLWSIDLIRGERVEQLFLPEGSDSLGNLVMYRGLLISLGSRGVTAFAQREAVEEEIRARKANDEHDAWALLREAEIAQLEHDHKRALASLQGVGAEQLSAEDAEKHRALLVRTLASVLREDPASGDEELTALASTVKTVDEQLEYRRLRAERLGAHGRTLDAFDEYVRLADEAGDALVNEDQLEIRLEIWAAGRLRDLWTDASEEPRKEMDARITGLAEQAKKEPIATQERVATRFAFHAASNDLWLAAVEAYAGERNFTRAENILLKLTQSPDAVVAARSLERLARLSNDFELRSDAIALYERLEQKHADQTLADGRTIRQVVDELRSRGELPAAGVDTTPAWSAAKLKIEQSATNSLNEVQDLLDGASTRLPYFDEYRFLTSYGDQSDHLTVARSSDQSVHWLVPLRARPDGSSDSAISVVPGAHQVMLLHAGYLHALSPVDKTVLWTSAVPDRQANPMSYQSWLAHAPVAMAEGEQILGYWALARGMAQEMSPTDSMQSMTSGSYVCTLGRRELNVIDVLTGEVRWTRRDVPTGGAVFGNEDVIFVAAGGREPLALRASDGKRLEIPKLAELLRKSLRLTSRGLVVVDAQSTSNLLGFRRSEPTFRLYDPVTKTEHWKKTYPNETRFTLLDEGTLVAYGKTTPLEIVNLSTGEAMPVSEPPDDEPPALLPEVECYVVADRERLYVILNSGQHNHHVYREGLPSTEVRGEMRAYERETGKFLWSQEVAAQNLVLQSFDQMPFLLFASREYVRKGSINYWSLSLLALDKRDRRELFSASIPCNPGFRTLNINQPQQYVELLSYNHRIRLTPDAAAAADSAEK